jgi:HemY protein
MKGLLWLIAVFAAAAGLSIALRSGEGYVILFYAPWRVEISLPLFVLGLLAIFIVAHVFLRLVSHATSLPAHVREFRIRQRESKGLQALLQSLQALYEGRFSRAERLASQAWQFGHPILGSLIAARAAGRMRDPARVQQWIERARAEGGDEWRQARQLTEAELLIEERRFEEALGVLKEIHGSGARHIAALTLLLRTEQGLGHWREVIRIARVLEKHRALPREAVSAIRLNARLALLAQNSHDLEGLRKLWRETSPEERRQPKVAAVAARACVRLGDFGGAQRIIEEALVSEWNSALVSLYAEAGERDALSRIEQAERWLKAHPSDAELLLTLGRLCVQCELWGKAQSYFEASLALQPSSAAHFALAQLSDQLGRSEEANRHYRASAAPLSLEKSLH